MLMKPHQTLSFRMVGSGHKTRLISQSYYEQEAANKFLLVWLANDYS